MTKARLIKNLYDYRETCARIEMLSLRVKKAERWLDMHGNEFISGTQLAGRTITDMPIAHGGVSSPTEKTAIRLMDADFDTAINIGDLDRDIREIETLKGVKEQMDILIGSLQDRERFVIAAHLIDGLRWKETGKRYAAEYGEELTEGALQHIMRKGLDRMLNVARAGE